jgi:hypothetical protein
MKALVITTVLATPNSIILDCLNQANKNGVHPYVVLDKKSGDLNSLPATVVTCQAQLKSSFELSKLLPWNSYSRKNLGYLAAITDGASWILETDDDNLPSGDFFRLDEIARQGFRVPKLKGWLNVYKYFGNHFVWPRGFPLQFINQEDGGEYFRMDSAEVSVPIFQVIADGDPDVDAIFRLTRALPLFFERADPLLVHDNSVTPFNSQATWWKRDVSVLMYFPSFVSWRAADIWRSLIAQRILHRFEMGLLYFGPLVTQIRNEHNLLVDFKEEIDCYLGSNEFWKTLQEIPNAELGESFESALIACYASLCSSGFLPQKELPLLQAWINDHNAILKNV